MAFWKQLSLSFLVIAAGVLLWIWFVPGADGVLRRIGVPEGMIALVAPVGQKSSTAGAGGQPAGSAQQQAQGQTPGQGQGAGNRRGGAAATLVVVQAVTIGKVNDRLSALGTGDAIQSVTVRPQGSANSWLSASRTSSLRISGWPLSSRAESLAPTCSTILCERSGHSRQNASGCTPTPTIIHVLKRRTSVPVSGPTCSAWRILRIK